jgi:hypothetical protein
MVNEEGHTWWVPELTIREAPSLVRVGRRQHVLWKGLLKKHSFATGTAEEC